MKSYDFGYDKYQFESLRSLAKQRSGIDIDASKMDMVYSRLVRIIRSSPYKNFAEYIRALNEGNEFLNMEFINSITTNLTSFFRERHHFEMLESIILPELLQKKGRIKDVKIWSAGCSSGEEPYSIACTLANFFSAKADWSYKVYASDIDTNVLEKAKRGIYRLDSVSNLTQDQLVRWFQKGTKDNEGFCRIKNEIKKHVDFFQFNLMEQCAFDVTFDVIFCRNVLIYFDPPSQKRILDQFMKQLSPSGFLITGHSESFMYRYGKTKLVAKTMYRKVV